MVETKDIINVISVIKEKRPKIIGIDGLDNVGKSCLAGILSSSIDYFHIKVDDYVEKNTGNYLDYVDIHRLKHSISNSNIIIEGVCLLDVARKAEINLDLLIYVKRLKGIPIDFEWEDGEVLEYGGDIEELIAKLIEEQTDFDRLCAEIEGKEILKEKSDIPTLSKEIYRYHARIKPQKLADIIYLRFTN